MVVMDLFYLKNLSLLLDLKIMFKTCSVVVEQLVESRRPAQNNGQDDIRCAPASILPPLAESLREIPRPSTTILCLAKSGPKL
jgi:hypothetical protein